MQIGHRIALKRKRFQDLHELDPWGFIFKKEVECVKEREREREKTKKKRRDLTHKQSLESRPPARV